MNVLNIYVKGRDDNKEYDFNIFLFFQFLPENDLKSEMIENMITKYSIFWGGMVIHF